MMKIIECPRDAMQGRKELIPTEKKIEYINALLQVGFDTLDFGSFVSPKAIPQMADTKEVLKSLEFGKSKTKLLAIIANVRGAEEALEYSVIDYLGFPFSISETFQQRNTNASREQAFESVKIIQNLCLAKGKKMVVYLSMGFGNPYNDVWSVEEVENWTKQFAALGIEIISLADTVGTANENDIEQILSSLIKQYPTIEFGAHLHASAENTISKVNAAVNAGCLRIDTALLGFGGCPMAADDLVGNVDSEKVIQLIESKSIKLNLDEDALFKAKILASQIFH